MEPTQTQDLTAAVLGTLMHAEPWEALGVATVAQRSSVADADAERTLQWLIDESVVIACPFDDGTRWRLSTAGVRFAIEMTGEQPRTWRP